MHLQIETSKGKVELDNKNDSISFKDLAKVYELLTGDELEITENEPEHEPAPRKQDWGGESDSDANIPDYHQPVQVDLMCPWCGDNERTTTLFGNHFMKCPKCGNKVFLAWATSRKGVPDHEGNYYKATEVYRDYNDKQADDELLGAMKKKVEEHNAD